MFIDYSNAWFDLTIEHVRHASMYCYPLDFKVEIDLVDSKENLQEQRSKIKQEHSSLLRPVLVGNQFKLASASK